MISTIHTEFSVYEINQAEKTIRRVSSTHEPTPNQGDDGDWRAYHMLRWAGQRLLVTWGIDEEGVLHRTLLSEVQHVDGDGLDIPESNTP